MSLTKGFMMKVFFVLLGFGITIVSLTHGFFSDINMLHSLLVHPITVLFGLLFVALGLKGAEKTKLQRND
jgi:hypothetical protein